LFLDNDQSESENSIDAVVRILVALRTIPTPDAIIGNFFAIARPKKPKSSKLPSIAQLNSHRRAVQELWCAVLRSKSLTTTQCKTILEIAERQIIPTFPKPQLLMDFFIGCYDHGGTTSLLALNGLFHLISTKNLDYPNFFSKLYALLDRNLMHVRYRSRFFRQLDIFLASTHLPAALVASFIKKLARLCLSAPPGAIVIVVPFVYNLFKRHRATTYMMHRPPIDSAEKEDWETDGYKDPFDDQQPDPLHTCAIESCVWELETLTTHWHPNVATLARIIKEQFTKDRYQIEDFLDHSYSSVRHPPFFFFQNATKSKK
jgi:U3 small nucleolar RNA-associated protein 19